MPINRNLVIMVIIHTTSEIHIFEVTEWYQTVLITGLVLCFTYELLFYIFIYYCLTVHVLNVWRSYVKYTVLLFLHSQIHRNTYTTYRSYIVLTCVGRIARIALQKKYQEKVNECIAELLKHDKMLHSAKIQSLIAKTLKLDVDATSFNLSGNNNYRHSKPLSYHWCMCDKN